MEFLDFLFFTIVIIYVIRSLIRIVMPMIFQRVVNKAQQQHQSAGRQQQNYSTNNRAGGQIKVDYVPQSKKGSVPDSEGEFVDYEEIK